jgi:tRNA threonylcarbamoyladenosine biosynthesis protein TsaB
VEEAPLILLLETATTVCSVGLARGSNLLALKELDGAYSHAENLHLFVEAVLQQADVTYKEITAVAVSKGPGSYTGLRIGVSAAKGFAFSLNVPLLLIDTLQAMAGSLLMETDSHFLVPMIDARRMEVYTAVYDRQLNAVEPVQALILGNENAHRYQHYESVALCGDGMEKCQSLLRTHPQITFLNNRPSAKWLAPLAYTAFQKNQFADTAYAEPYYLKEFVAGVKKSF